MRKEIDIDRKDIAPGMMIWVGEQVTRRATGEVGRIYDTVRDGRATVVLVEFRDESIGMTQESAFWQEYRRTL